MTRWNNIRRIADELELKIHLAGMDARDRWRDLKPRLIELEQTVARTGERASEALDHELSSIGDALRRLHDDIARP